MQMKIILIHNHYQQPGGEDVVLASEEQLLGDRGHEVFVYTVHNDRVDTLSRPALFLKTLWNREIHREVREFVRAFKPEVVHFHNTLPLISPAAYYAVHAEGVAVVQTLHNYRLICPNALLFRDGGPCEACVGRAVPWPGVRHACYRRSRAATGTVATMLSVHRALDTWRRAVDRYIALTSFSRRKFIEGGLPAEKIAVKPNFLKAEITTDTASPAVRGDYVLFAGRLSVEKGITPLLQAWTQHGVRQPLVVVGDGPLAGQVQEAAARHSGISWLGRLPRSRVLALMQNATALVLPSLVYENFPVTLVEAFSVGLPAIVSRHGALAEVVEESRTGLHFRPGDPADLADKVAWAFEHAGAWRQMQRAARAEFAEKYTPERNYETLMMIYEQAIEQVHA
jgi:glycosyltransferase involved in cell wall biosynthesis